MRQAPKGDRTKYKLADALKTLLNEKPLEKIRIWELTEQCDIHRQTFYYHFADVYDLFSWCIRSDGPELSAWLVSFPSWQQALAGLLQHIVRNRSYFQAILDKASPDDRQALLDEVSSAMLARFQAGRVFSPDTAHAGLILFQSMTEQFIRGDSRQSPAEAVALLEGLIGARDPTRSATNVMVTPTFSANGAAGLADGPAVSAEAPRSASELLRTPVR